MELSKDSYYQSWQNAQKEINSIHAALDTLPGITSKRVKVSDYDTVELTINARLFAWISNVAFGSKKIINTEEN